MSNMLKNETSPYLLQHSENPVNWYLILTAFICLFVRHLPAAEAGQ